MVIILWGAIAINDGCSEFEYVYLNLLRGSRPLVIEYGELWISIYLRGLVRSIFRRELKCPILMDRILVFPPESRVVAPRDSV